ncbi:MAG: A/G-specific adenine glycosylase [Pseudomonadota bacterium]
MTVTQTKLKTYKAKNQLTDVLEKKAPDEFVFFRRKILSWYDKHRRVLPWRAQKGETANPYYVWLSEIMLQQTTVATVGPYFSKFTHIWPSLHDLAKAPQDDVMHEWAGLGYYARARNLHKCAQIVSKEHKGIFPKTQEELIKLPGIGEYSSNSIAAIAYNKPANVVDGNVERVMARYFAIKEPMPASKKQLKEIAGVIAWPEVSRSGDYAQALMDLGATICTPKSPKCMLCPIRSSCAGHEAGIAETLPKKSPKKAKPQKYGRVYWITNKNGDVLFERRDEKAMLGGMLGLPAGEWILENPIKLKENYKNEKDTALKVKHSFTHFDLHLDIISAELNDTIGDDQKWIKASELENIGVPTLFKKAIKLMK